MVSCSLLAGYPEDNLKADISKRVYNVNYISSFFLHAPKIGKFGGICKFTKKSYAAKFRMYHLQFKEFVYLFGY